MITKIVKIKNTGKFRSCTPKGIQLNRFTILYSENGRGKTTLSNVFRSLHEQNGEWIVGRKTIGGSGEQAVDLLTENGMLSFREHNWLSKPDFDLEIFDSSFVSQNVYSRHVIEHDQKKQLYLFTIGKQGGELADHLVSLDDDLKKKNAKKKETEKELVQGVQGVVSPADFLKFPPKHDLEDEVQKQSITLKAMEKQNEIKAKPYCSAVSLPSFDKQKFLGNISGNTFQQLVDNAEELTKKHIQQHLDQRGEKWLEYGVSKITSDEKCPFCDQDLKNTPLVTAFKTYFSEEYKRAIHTVNLLETTFTEKFSNDALLNLQKHFHTNHELVSYWRSYDAIDDVKQLDWEQIKATWDDFTRSMTTLIAEKKLAPLEQINVSSERIASIDKYLDLLNELTAYNGTITQINKTIEARKTLADNTNIQEVKTKLTYLTNVKLRYSEEKVGMAEKYTQLLATIRELERAKNEVRLSLNAYTTDIFAKYETQINRHLTNCGASFTISDYKSSFVGGRPSSNFSLKINDMAVDVGNDKSPLTGPSFKNTLSEGDKSSLAFAFFLAKLESDPEIRNKVIIFDDPISSMDNHRKSYTADQIMKFSVIARQVIVLTHDTFFARVLWDKFAEKKTLLSQFCIKREGKYDSTIDIWDIEAETRSDYYHLYHTLADFLDGKLPPMNFRSVAMCIRPILEGNLRVRFPRDFTSSEWLGGFIQKVRTSTEPHLSLIQGQLADLEDINDYSKKYHHDQNPFADTVPINEAELLAYVRRTLNALRGLHNAVI
ncbi:AAA family ATPase [Paenibacillus abyssi]|uniref:Protein CR006 P-loop domain-containing protein n=1 Tax=Paenibacillus abyssi TaxID=1340531 RepID=A0A917D2Z1_9BACL|nr:AAA family ATPase [Paenibacillus abyssi]GGG07606.1 hypothetical protein GCM10010916_25610 [Paenibacillus abyssi]